VGGLKLEEGLSVPSKSEGLPYEDSGRLTISIKEMCRQRRSTVLGHYRGIIVDYRGREEVFG